MSETDNYSFSGEPGLRLNPYTPEELQEIKTLYLQGEHPPELPPYDPYARREERDVTPRGNVREDDTGLHAVIPFPNELPTIRIRFRDGNTTFIFSGSYEGRHSLTGKLLSRMEKASDSGVVY